MLKILAENCIEAGLLGSEYGIEYGVCTYRADVIQVFIDI